MGKNSVAEERKAWKQRSIPVSGGNFLHFTLMALQEAPNIVAVVNFPPSASSALGRRWRQKCKCFDLN